MVAGAALGVFIDDRWLIVDDLLIISRRERPRVVGGDDAGSVLGEDQADPDVAELYVPVVGVVAGGGEGGPVFRCHARLDAALARAAPGNSD